MGWRDEETLADQGHTIIGRRLNGYCFSGVVDLDHAVKLVYYRQEPQRTWLAKELLILAHSAPSSPEFHV